MPLLFLHLSDTNNECSLAIGHLLQAVPEEYTSGKPISLKYVTRVGIALTDRTITLCSRGSICAELVIAGALASKICDPKIDKLACCSGHIRIW